MVALTWFSPVLPDLPWLTAAFVGVATPAVTLWLIDSIHASDDPSSERARSYMPSTAWLISGLLSVLMLWFSFGFFGVKPVFIPSNSMEPEVSAGSIAVIRDVSARDVRIGDVILYDLNGTDVLHRVIAEHDDGTFTTKGDDNNTADPQPVQRNQVKGRLVFDVPYAGWAPIWMARALGTLTGSG
jgi:signal peptidase